MRKNIALLCLVGAALLGGCTASAPPPPAAVQASAPQEDLVPATASAGYPLKECVVTGEELDADRVVMKYKGREVQFCCAQCVHDFKKDPDKYMAKVDAAEKARRK